MSYCFQHGSEIILEDHSLPLKSNSTTEFAEDSNSNIAQQPIDADLHNFFTLKRSLRVFIADILLIHETSATQ